MGTWEFPHYLLFRGEVGFPTLLWLPQSVKAQTSHIHTLQLWQEVAFLVSPEGWSLPVPKLGGIWKALGCVSVLNGVTAPSMASPPLLCQKNPPVFDHTGSFYMQNPGPNVTFCLLPRSQKLENILQVSVWTLSSPIGHPHPLPLSGPGAPPCLPPWQSPPHLAWSCLYLPLPQSELLQGGDWLCFLPQSVCWVGLSSCVSEHRPQCSVVSGSPSYWQPEAGAQMILPPPPRMSQK